jgi:phosphoribosylamine--glycine ligase
MLRHNIPTARFASFTERAAAHAYVDQQGAPIVVKADGLAAGKGVVVATNLAEAHAAIDRMLPPAAGKRRGTEAWPGVVIEEFLDGEEASFIVMVDGRNVLPLASSQDHKRIGDGDTGPNTGGMGAYSPAPVVTPEVHARAMREIILPTVRGMAADGIPYTGFLYAGLMVGKDGSVKTVEFNCRLGDPETQPIMMRLQVICSTCSSTLSPAGSTSSRPVGIDESPSESFLRPPTIPLPRVPETRSADCRGSDDSHVFHAGTSEQDGRIVTAGGRVLCVTTLAENVRQAQKRAYDLITRIHFDGMQYRRDIGHRAASR